VVTAGITYTQTGHISTLELKDTYIPDYALGLPQPVSLEEL